MSEKTKELGRYSRMPNRRRAKTVGIAALTALFAVGAFAAWTALAPAPPQLIISTFAGGGAGDGKSALLASVHSPTDVAVDAHGNVYVADLQNSRIRKIDAAGVITTVAGNGTPGYSGDGGAAVNAMIDQPTGLAFDASGNLYFSDLSGGRVRKIDTNGIITAVAGSGFSGFAGDGGPATSAILSNPSNVAVAADGSVYVADSGNQRIRKIDASGIITTVAGTGSAGFGGDGDAADAAQLNSPRGLAFDAAGNLFIADASNQRIRKVDAATHIITTVAGTGTSGLAGDGGDATAAQLSNPYDVGFDSHGNLYIADGSNERVRKVDTNGIITTVAGGGRNGDGDGGSATDASFLFVDGIGIGPDDALYFVDETLGKVHKVDAAGILTTVAGNGKGGYCCDGGPATGAPLPDPYGIAVGAGNEVYIADQQNARIRKVRVDGSIATVAGTGSILFSGDGGPAISAGLYGPKDVTADAAGNLYIVDTLNHRIRKVGVNGVITTVAGDGDNGYSGDGGAAVDAEFGQPEGIAVDGAGNIYVADTNNHAIRKIDTAGIITAFAGNGSAGLAGDNGPATQALLHTPRALAFDANTGALYVADSGNDRIRRIDASGTITTVAGTRSGNAGNGGMATAAELRSPEGVAIDSTGNLYIADSGNHSIRKVDTAGIITLIAGTGAADFAGDGGLATAAKLNWPSRLAIDTHGNLLVSDHNNRRVRLISAAYTIGGTASGLVGGNGFTISLNDGAQILSPSVNGSFVFPRPLPNGSNYSVAVTAQPKAPAEICTLANGSGTVAGADVTNLVVTCTTIIHTVTLTAGTGGTISPSGAQKVADGTLFHFSVTPDAGFSIAGVSGCGASPAKSDYSTSAITADCTVVATFTPTVMPVNGVCGSDNGKTLSTVPTNLCTSGTASAVLGSGPWSWTCQGSNGGSNASCSAQKMALTPSSTSLNFTPNPAKVGQNVTAEVGVTESQAITRTGSTNAIAAGTPGGSVTVSGGGASCAAPLVNGSGSCALVFHSAGNFVVTATYMGDATHAASSISQTITINAVATDAALVSAPALDRWALVALTFSLFAIGSRRRRRD